MTTNPQALTSLKIARTNLRFARMDAITAADLLEGARATRANELAEKIADCICFVERLTFCVEADIRYEEQRGAE